MKYLLIVALQMLSCHLEKPSNTFDTLETGIVAAKEKNVKIFVVFDVFGSPTNYVDKILQDEKIATALNHNVIVRLMCDDKSKLNDTLSIGKRMSSNILKSTISDYKISQYASVVSVRCTTQHLSIANATKISLLRSAKIRSSHLVEHFLCIKMPDFKAAYILCT